MKKKIEHVALIMDGNGRWAKKNGVSTYNGHKKGVDRIEDIIKVAQENDIKYVTLYAFSKENWGRSEEEVGGLLKLINIFYKTGFKRVLKNNIKVKVIGSRENIPVSTLKLFDKIEEESKNNTALNLNLAFNYSAHDELVDAFNILQKEGKKEITAEDIQKNLYTAFAPNVDLLIRTSGEERISNFLLWQIAYAELVFDSTLWPDFDQDKFQECINEYYKRDRRFGKR